MYPIHLIWDFATMSHRIWFRNSELTSSAKIIIHHKVTARIVSMFSEQDALVATRAEQHQQHQHSHA